MKNKNLLAACCLGVMLLSSCSKTLILTDGQNTKKIKVASQIVIKKDDSNNQILSFESVNGTKYTIDASKYNYTIK